MNLVGDNLKIKSVFYTNVKELTIFVQNNNGSDVTKISSIKLFGFKLNDTNMKELKKVGWGWSWCLILYKTSKWQYYSKCKTTIIFEVRSIDIWLKYNQIFK